MPDRGGLTIWQAPSGMWIVGLRGGESLNALYTWQEAIDWANKYLRVENGSEYRG